jgi:hypothetical protein
VVLSAKKISGFYCRKAKNFGTDVLFTQAAEFSIITITHEKIKKRRNHLK